MMIERVELTLLEDKYRNVLGLNKKPLMSKVIQRFFILIKINIVIWGFFK